MTADSFAENLDVGSVIAETSAIDPEGVRLPIHFQARVVMILKSMQMDIFSLKILWTMKALPNTH